MRNTTLNGMKRNAQKDITRCICDFNPGIGDFICCDKCSVWQHMRCMGVPHNRVPKIYECEQCNPRSCDKEAAVKLQLLLKAEESTSSSEEESSQQQQRAPTCTPQQRAPTCTPQQRKTNAAKRPRSRKTSSNSVKSEESNTEQEDIVDYRRSYKELKENMYSPTISHKLEPRTTRTEGQPSFGASPPGVARVHPQAGGYTPARVHYPAMLHLLNHGPSKIVITRQTLKPGAFISEYMGHFKQLSEYYEEIGGKSTLLKRPMNYVLHYPLLDICVDTREYGNVVRFIRRSCQPNAHTKSYIEEGKLHIGIYALELISPNSEITIGFNFPVDQYQYTQTCSCSSPGCLVTKNNETLTTRAKKPFSRTNSTESPCGDLREDEHKKQRLSREEVKIQSYIQVFEKIERDEERKRVLIENSKSNETLRSPSRGDTAAGVRGDHSTEDTTPSRPGNKRRRKGSGKKARKASGGSSVTGARSPSGGSSVTGARSPSGGSSVADTRSPEHFTFESSGSTALGGMCSPSQCPTVPAPTAPAYTVTEPVLTNHHVQYNGYEADIQLRAINTAPSSRYRQNFQLRNNTSFITPIKVQKDGFIVPVHGSLLNYKTKNGVPAYKTTKKRWLENFIRDGVPKSPVTSPKADLSPSREMLTPEKEMLSPVPQEGTIREAEGLEAATRTLNISDDIVSPDPAIQQSDSMETEHSATTSAEFDTTVSTCSASSTASNTISTSSISMDPVPVSTPVSTAVPAAVITPVPTAAPTAAPADTPTVAPSSVTIEKKKRVSLADYRKRVQSRSSKPPSLSSESDTKPQPVSPSIRPVFEPISPGPPEQESSLQTSLLEEFTRPSLSESLSDESIHPCKIRKIDYSTSPSDQHMSEDIAIPSEPEKPVNGTPATQTLTSPPHALSQDTFSKIKEILSQSNPGLSRNLNVSSLKTNLTMYDPNQGQVFSASSVKQYQYPSQYSDEMWDTKRLKQPDYTAKFYKENDKR